MTLYLCFYSCLKNNSSLDIGGHLTVPENNHSFIFLFYNFQILFKYSNVFIIKEFQVNVKKLFFINVYI